MGKLTHTVKGPIASFRSADKADIESLKLHFLPEQAGSGDPSPTNIRPITGWTGCNLKRAKKNLLDENNPNIYYIGAEKSNGVFTNTVIDTRDGVQVSVVGYKDISTPIDVLKSSAIITSPSTVQLTAIITQSYSEMTYLCVKHNGTLKDFKVMFPITIPVGTEICVSVDILSTDVGTVGGFKMNNIQIEVGDASTAYESYSGLVIPVTFPDGQTIYGGYIDPIKGEIWKEYDEIVFDGSDADAFTYVNTSDSSGISRHYFNTKVLDRIVKNNSTTITYSDSATPTSNSFEHRTTICYYIGTPTNQVILNIVATECDPTAESFNSYLQNHPVHLVYKLATPVLVATFDPTDLQTFLDYNNFWSDTNDDTEVEYAFADRLSERKLIMDTPHIESASGAVASFSTDMKAPIVDLKAHFTPVQEGSGDPSPENVRAIKGLTNLKVTKKHGKNLLKPGSYSSGRGVIYTYNVDGSIDLKGEFTSGYSFINLPSTFEFYLPPGTYTLSGSISGVTVYILLNGDDINFKCSNATSKVTKTITEGGMAKLQVAAMGSFDTTIYPQLEIGSSKTAFESPEEYTVIPIEFPATKNLLNALNCNSNVNHLLTASEGTWEVTEIGTGSSRYVWSLDTYPAGTYTISAKYEGAGLSGIRMICSSASCGGTWNQYYGAYYIDPPYSPEQITFTTTEAFTIGLVFKTYGTDHAYDPGKLYNIQLERGSYNTGYEPYGIAWGGYVDLIRGKFVAEYYRGIVKSAAGKQGNFFYNVTSNIGMPAINGTNDGLLCDYFPNNPNTAETYDKQSITIYSNQIMRWIDEDHINSSLSDYNAFLQEHRFEIVYKVKNPVEYDLTPQQLKTLKGLNNIWSDANGETEVKYWTH